MLHEEVARGAERDGGDAGVRAEEALVVAVVGDAVVAVGVVIDQAEVETRPRRHFRRPAQAVQTRRDWTRPAGAVTARERRDRVPGVRVDEGAVREEAGAAVDAENGGAVRVEISFLP